ncbi:MAG: T9SS type A sorting domain-containing protein [Bacteroidia bacterium]
MKQGITLLFNILISISIFAQVPKTVVVEHFTNTRCSICASRNPGFYSNLANQENTIHIAFHPSAPYPTCVLNAYNMSENDARTGYYGLFGSTPDFVIQGTVISPSANFSSPALFDPFEMETSPVSINVSHSIVGSNVELRVAILTEATNNLNDLVIFAALKEDVVNYAAPNGEDVHYDVFRKSYFSIEGTSLSLASTVGDSVVLTASLSLDPSWDINNVSSLIILQESGSKEVIQAKEAGIDDVPLTIQKAKNIEFSIFPNPASSKVTIQSSSNDNSHFEIYNALGKKLKSGTFNNLAEIKIDDLLHGVYFVKISSGNKEKVQRLLVK